MAGAPPLSRLGHERLSTAESFNGSPINMVEMVGFESTVPEGRVLQTLRLPTTGYISEILSVRPTTFGTSFTLTKQRGSAVAASEIIEDFVNLHNSPYSQTKCVTPPLTLVFADVSYRFAGFITSFQLLV